MWESATCRQLTSALSWIGSALRHLGGCFWFQLGFQEPEWVTIGWHSLRCWYCPGGKQLLSSTLVGSPLGPHKLDWQKTDSQENHTQKFINMCTVHTLGVHSDKERKGVVRTRTHVAYRKNNDVVEKWQEKGKGVWASRGRKLWEGKRGNQMGKGLVSKV